MGQGLLECVKNIHQKLIDNKYHNEQSQLSFTNERSFRKSS